MKLLFCFLLLFTANFVFSQSNTVQEDSNKVFFIKQYLLAKSDVFESRPELTKEQNKLLKERYKAKIKKEIELIESKSVITSGLLFDRVESIFKRILSANPSIPSDTKLVLYKSTEFNAFTMGEDVIFIHIGLLHYLKSDEEIGMVIAHEIAHNTLKHVENSMIDYVRIVTNDTLKRQLKTISKQSYNQVSALNALVLPRILEDREKSRAHEFSADSLGLVYMLNANFSAKKSISAFVEMDLLENGLNQVPDLLNALNHRHIPELKAKEEQYKRSGSLGEFSKDTSKLADYLSTHPYERDRFLSLAIQSNQDTTFANYTIGRTISDSVFYNLVNHEITKIEFENKNFSSLIYFSCKALTFSPTDSKNLKRLGVAFSALSYFKQKRIAGKFLMLQNTNFEEDFDRVCAFLFTLSPMDCKKLAEISIKNSNTKLNDDDLEYKVIQMIDFVEKKDFSSLEIFLTMNNEEIRNSEYEWISNEIIKQVYQIEKLNYLIPYIR